jgi:hypothetical protein
MREKVVLKSKLRGIMIVVMVVALVATAMVMLVRHILLLPKTVARTE